MGRIESCFESLRSKGEKGLITFITAGDPSIENTLDYMQSLVDGGADVIELGVPFSDPMADGPTIQRASERSLAAGTDLSSIFMLVRAFRERNASTPVILMGYMNPFERLGFERFAKEAKASGVDGVLVVDLPPEESVSQNKILTLNGVRQIFLIAPNSSEDRIKKVGELAAGFIYYVSVKGVTGDKSISTSNIQKSLELVRNGTRLPIGLGFGIKTPESAREAAKLSDAVVVGSALVDIIEKETEVNAARKSLESFVKELKGAVDA
jgi:tryptophan synthase alpha chain